MSQKKQKEKEVVREFGPSSFSVDNRTSIFILTFMIMLGGYIAYIGMPRESFPEVVIPKIYVGTTYPGNSPTDIENLITRPIEKELKTIKGLKEITSTSIQDYSTIIAEFNTDVELSKALQDVKDAVDKAKSDLPTDLDQEPNIFEMDVSEFPILNINLLGDMKMSQLKEYAEYLQDEIEKMPEVSEVVIKGAPEREVKINVDVFKMNALDIAFSDIESAIAQENVTISGGDILSDGFRRNLRVVGEFNNMNEVGNVIVKNRNNSVVYLRDIADISFDYEEPKSYARSQHLPVVSLDVKKRGGENLIEAIDKIKVLLEKAQEERFPQTLQITLTGDQSKDTRKQVANLENSIIFGVILVVLVLLFFLGLRNALFVGVAIPLSMFMGFIILNMMDVTLNTMVLFSLVLALGMLVDNGIVVVENVYRLMQEGKSSLVAAKEGVGEVAVPIIASTATTLAAFMPLLFWDSIMGEFMKYLPITLIIVLSSSLFVALIINPVLTSVLMVVEKEKKKINKRLLIITSISLVVFAGLFYLLKVNIMGNLLVILLGVILLNALILRPAAFWFQNNLLIKIEELYYNTIRFALKGWNPFFFLAATFLLLIGSFVLVGIKEPPVSLFPENEPRYVNVFIEMPLGTDIESTNDFTERIEYRLDTILNPYDSIVESVIVNVGEGTSDPMQGPSIGRTPHKARITVNFVDFELRGGVATSKVMEEIRKGLQGYPGAKIMVDKDQVGPPVGKPINIEVIGEDYDKLIDVSEGVLEYLKAQNIPGIEELKTDLERNKPELLIDVDRDAARTFGLSTAQIASTIRNALFGKEVSKYKEGEDDYPIMVRFQEEERYQLEDLLNQRISFKDRNTGTQVSVPISSVADVKYTSSFGSIKRKDMDRVITISSNVIEGYNADNINKELKAALSNYNIPNGYTVKFTGEQQEQAETMRFLMVAFGVAVGLIFLIIVAQFNSLASPLIIMLSVLFSTIGVFLGIVIFNEPIVVLMTGIGIISLAGIVVNNAIVLMDYIDLIRARRRKELGLGDERLPFKEIINSIIEGGKTRLRPVLLTAITTILGLVPLAIGLNFNFETFLSHWDPEFYVGGDNVVFWGPMAWTVIYGLTFSTFLTLVIVPVMYMSFDTVTYWMANKFSQASKEILEDDDQEDTSVADDEPEEV